jgi:hypothetical protein
MSADNFITLNTKNFVVKYWMSETVVSKWRCKSLFDAIKKAKELDDEYQTEYGVKLI